MLTDAEAEIDANADEKFTLCSFKRSWNILKKENDQMKSWYNDRKMLK